LRVGAHIAAACLVVASCRDGAGPAAGQKPAETSFVAARVLTVGDVAPDFSLPGSDGKQYSLAGYRGRQAVVLAWFAKAFTEA